MDRFLRQYGALLLPAMLAASLLAAGGCRTALTTAAYLIKGTDVDPAFPGLKEKRVAVVCRPVASLTYGYSSDARQLAQEVANLLRNRVPRIKVIDQDEVSDWLDNQDHDVTEYPEIGDALGAEMVVGIDLEHFSVHLDQTLYQGNASAVISVHDCTKGGEIVFEDELHQLRYPPNTGLPTSSRTESQFRRQYVRIVADHIGRYFYAHDRYADYALDAAADH